LRISTTLRLLAQKREHDSDFQPLPFFYSPSLSFQQFGANVFEHKGCALDPNRARQYRVLAFDAHDALEADVHVGFHDILPELRAMTVPNRAEDDRTLHELGRVGGEIEDAGPGGIVLEDHRILHVGVVDGALFAEKVDDLDRVAASMLPVVARKLLRLTEPEPVLSAMNDSSLMK